MITLTNIGNGNHELMSFSIEKTLSSVPHVSDVRIVSNKEISLNHNYSLYKIPDYFNLLDYCDFCIKSIDSVIDTEFVLINQYDGIATNPSAWTDEFLEYDYVGSLSHVDHPPVQGSLQSSGFYEDYKSTNWFTCGGGLSLRSKKLLTILAEDDKIKTINYKDGYDTPFISEDLVITLINRQYLEKEHGIRFAPVELGMKFCAEVATGYTNALGFHGWYNAPLYLTEDECLFFFKLLKKPDYLKDTMPMQMCKYHTMIRGYLRLRDYFIEEDKWIVY
jgi:hypothetical protein